MRNASTPGAPRFHSGSIRGVRQGSSRWRYSDGKTHPVTVRKVAPAKVA